jgi:DcuC family C4-dicarboxylate transporter
MKLKTRIIVGFGMSILVPLVPLIILVLGNKYVPVLKMGVAQAMVLGAIFTLLVSWCDPQKFSKEFFRGCV